jgi:TRAP-type C4-dicarboxylate transport system substrate-binding protein
MVKDIKRGLMGFGLCFSILIFLAGTSFAGETELKFATWASPNHYAGKATKNWIDAVNKGAVGKVKITEYPGGQLYGSKDTHMAVAKGSVDIGQGTQPRMLGMIPMLLGTYLPFLFEDIGEASKAYQGESREIIERALMKKNMKLIFIIFNDGSAIFSNQKNIATVDDIKGLRLLTVSPIVSKVFHKLGAAPDTSIPYTEHYMALKRGVADATAAPITSGYFRKTYEVAKYITEMNMSFPCLMVVVNKKVWNRMPADVQQLMLEEGKKQEAFCIASAKGWQKKFSGLIQKKGGVITTLPTAERDKIKKVSQELWQDWAKKNGADAQRLLELNTKQ